MKKLYAGALLGALLVSMNAFGFSAVVPDIPQLATGQDAMYLKRLIDAIASQNIDTVKQALDEINNLGKSYILDQRLEDRGQGSLAGADQFFTPLGKARIPIMDPRFVDAEGLRKALAIIGLLIRYGATRDYRDWRGYWEYLTENPNNATYPNVNRSVV